MVRQGQYWPIAYRTHTLATRPLDVFPYNVDSPSAPWNVPYMERYCVDCGLVVEVVARPMQWFVDRQAQYG